MNDVEIICVDDCSSDDTGILLCELARTSAQIRVFYNEVNCGPASARNLAIRHAKGTYLAFLDADDTWAPTHLENALSHLKGGAGFVYSNFTRVNSVTGAEREIFVPDKASLNLLLGQNFISLSSVVIDTRKVPNFQFPLIRYAEDYSAWLNLLRDGVSGQNTGFMTMRYSYGRESESSSKFKVLRARFLAQKHAGIGVLRQGYGFLRFVIYAVSRLRAGDY